MRAEDIHSYKDLESYVKLELAQQTAKRKTVELSLTEEWFFKCAKLIKFCIKDSPNEKFKDVELPKDCKKIIVKVNKVFTIITRK